jgi:hypothetical protein
MVPWSKQGVSPYLIRPPALPGRAGTQFCPHPEALQEAGRVSQEVDSRKERPLGSKKCLNLRFL